MSMLCKTVIDTFNNFENIGGDGPKPVVSILSGSMDIGIQLLQIYA